MWNLSSIVYIFLEGRRTLQIMIRCTSQDTPCRLARFIQLHIKYVPDLLWIHCSFLEKWNITLAEKFHREEMRNYMAMIRSSREAFLVDRQSVPQHSIQSTEMDYLCREISL